MRNLFTQALFVRDDLFEVPIYINEATCWLFEVSDVQPYPH